jgi:exopolyphosphatase / guanosine-5'-triphosphate,3'-diphosphate pyrophosphatase
LEMKDVNIINSINAEEVDIKDLKKISEKLLSLPASKRSEVKGINENRVDAIHLGGLLLVELLKMAKAEEIILSDASLRDGLIIDYIEKNILKLGELEEGKNIRERSCLLMAMKYETDIAEKKHVGELAIQIFDQLKNVHLMDDGARELLQNSCLIYDVGVFVNFQDYHKHSAYLILNGRLRGFNNEERIMLSLLARYHRKGKPKKKHEVFGQMQEKERDLLRGLAGILRIAVGLDKTKNQWVERLTCEVQEDSLIIKIFGDATMDLEIWEAQRLSDVLAKFLKKDIEIVKGKN